MSGYVVCPERITSPIAHLEYPSMRPSEPCGLRCKVIKEAELMEFRCSRGHQFIATRKQIQR